MTEQIPGPEQSPAAERLARLMDGFLVTQLIYVAVTLGTPEVLAGGPLTGAEVADAVGADRLALTRVLRGLAAEGVLAEDGEGRFALTELGDALREAPGGALIRGELYYRAAAGLLESVRDGGVAFPRAYGEPFFDYLAGHREVETAFQSSMTARSRQETDAVTQAYDFSGLRTLVDVGGGQGTLLAALLARNPDLRGILVDRAAVLERADQRFHDAGVAARAECVAGDFFDELPSGYEAYLLSRVLHDWGDDDAQRILATCRRAMPDHGRLLVVDATLPELAVDRPAAIRMDLFMLTLFGSRERTEAELVALLHAAGFEVRRVVPIASPAGIAVVEAVPRPGH